MLTISADLVNHLQRPSGSRRLVALPELFQDRLFTTHTDFSISLVLVFLLRSSKSSMKKTNDMISRLVSDRCFSTLQLRVYTHSMSQILFTFNTGAPPCTALKCTSSDVRSVRRF